MTISAVQLGKPLKVTKRIQETPDAVSLVLQIPTELKQQFQYKAGQFVTFFMSIKGEPINRSYSLSTSPLVDEEFKITVRKIPGGRGSTFLCDQVKEGDTLLTSPPAGAFFKPPIDPNGVHYMLFAAGSGITPVFSILKTVLKASPKNSVTLTFGNRTEDNIIYRQEIDQMASEFSDRLKIIYVLTQPNSTWSGRTGRINGDIVKDVLKSEGHNRSTEYYLCGPDEFMSNVRSALLDNNVNPEYIRQESFAQDLHKPSASDSNPEWTYIGPDQDTTIESPETVIAILNGVTHELKAKKGQNILEALLESGAQPPYSCMDGACMACLGKVLEGRVYQEDPGILIDENFANCETLTCQAKPLSRIVKVTFDNL